MCASNCKLLIVDDDAVNLENCFEMLNDRYELVFAQTGGEALAVARDSHPDLILLDVMLPDMDGFETCRRIKEDPLFADLPIIFLTAKHNLADKILGFDAGGADYITKPFEIEEMLARIDTHVNLRKARLTIGEYNQKLEELVARQTRELINSERRATFGLMIKGIIHNLNGPLSGIGLNSTTINKRMTRLRDSLIGADIDEMAFNEMDEILESMTLVSECCAKMNEIIRVLMAKSHYEKSDYIKTFDLNELLSNEIKFLNADMRFKHKIRKVVRLMEAPLMVTAVPSELSQVFHNLMINAIDAVTLSTEPQITVASGVEEQNTIWFSVLDNGPGVDESVLPRIFEPFFTTKRKEKASDHSGGLGIGLYTCVEIVHSYGGEIDVRNQEDVGVRFTVRLPCR